MLVGVSARGGCAADRLNDAQVMASKVTTCSSYRELLLPQWAPAWGLCLQASRRCPSGRRRQQQYAAMEASHGIAVRQSCLSRQARHLLRV